MTPDWDRAYSNGTQDGWAETEWSPRFALIGGFCEQAHVRDILDVGCGTGLLRASLCLHSSLTYTGLDCSSVAIQRLKDKWDGDFICADAEHWMPRRCYDAVILNEVLYYFDNPSSALSKYYSAVGQGGIFIVSIWKQPTRLWRYNPNLHAIKTAEAFLPAASKYEIFDGKGTWVVFVERK